MVGITGILPGKQLEESHHGESRSSGWLNRASLPLKAGSLPLEALGLLDKKEKADLLASLSFLPSLTLGLV